MKEKLTVIKRKRNRQAFPLIVTICLCVWCAIFLFLLAWGVMTAFKDAENYIYDSVGLPWSEYGWKYQNFFKVFEEMEKILIVNGRHVSILEVVYNTVFYCVVYGVVMVIFPMTTSYVYAKYSKRVKWTKFIWIVVLINMYVPISASMATFMLLTMRLGIYDNLYLYIVTSMGGFGGCFLIYYATWKGLSWEYAEAAFIDGAGHFQVYTGIMFPMTLTIFAVLCTTDIISLWQQYESLLLYLPSYPTLAVTVFNLTHLNITATVRMASLILLAIPMTVVFIFMKDKMMGSLTLGGLKG